MSRCSICSNLCGNNWCYYYSREITLGDGNNCPGFKMKDDSSGGGCFPTSACVKYLGKADDCTELTTLRAFRDNYMKTNSCGKALVEEYYRVAPQIVSEIDSSDDSGKTYDYIYSVISRCVALIGCGKNSEAQNEYVKMVNTLKVEYNVN